MKFQVKGGESELLGIDLKNVSLKRKITNDDSTVSVICCLQKILVSEKSYLPFSNFCS